MFNLLINTQRDIIIYEIKEGTFISEKIEDVWNNEHFEIKNKSLLYEESRLNYEELRNNHIYSKGSKK